MNIPMIKPLASSSALGLLQESSDVQPLLPLSDRGGLLGLGVGPVEADVRPVYEIVLFHVHSLGIGGLLPFLPYSPAWTRAAEPDALVVLLDG